MNIKIGNKVRVSDNLSKTKAAFGVNDYMLQMRGTIRKVSSIATFNSTRGGGIADGISIPDNNGSNWTFLEEDLTLSKETPSIPPVMFDPKNL